jgi:hypothetical protein
MAVTNANAGPYAPSSAILDFIDRYRNRGLTAPITSDVLARAGVSDSLIPRTMQALETLELVSNEGKPTETLEALRRAAEPEFKNQLAAWIKAVYADVLSFVDAGDDETAIRDAFRPFNPVGQQPRMVSLFMGLCRAAGMRNDDQSNASARPRARKPGISSVGTVMRGGVIVRAKSKERLTPDGIPAPIAGLLTKLPPDQGEWTKAERDKFLTTFGAVLDFCFAVVEKPKKEAGDE